MNLNQCLSKQDAIALLELISSAIACYSEQDFRAIMAHLARLIPHEFGIAVVAQKNDQGRITSFDAVNISYPNEWISLYIQQSEHLRDPIFRANFTGFRLQYFDDILRTVPADHEFRDVAFDFGIKKGYVHGLENFRKTEGSMFCFSGRKIDRDQRTEAILELVIPHIHQAFLRATGQPGKSVTLSLKEQEVLKWLKQGKTTWDISVILGISERTVKFHIGNIMQKLNATTRTHAVAIAIEQGYIDIE